MPNAALRPCPGGCGQKVTSGRCPACSRQTEQRRGTSTQRGYGVAWRRFRAYYVNLLIQAGIVPICGAALPSGPDTMKYSRCRQVGLFTDTDLQLDHEPPLMDDERTHVHVVCNRYRVGFLCSSCHAAKTVREQQGVAA